MYAPHTVTIYNIVQEIDPATLDEVEKIYITILRGVMLQASKGVNVRESGLEGASDIALFSEAGYKAFLIGESLVRQPDPGKALEELLAKAAKL